MSQLYQIRAVFDASTILVWQAYDDRIADPALAHQRFVAPFSFHRMTWIKPSFAWMMHRSRWAGKSGQTRILGLRISRTAWEDVLSQAVLTHPDPKVFPDRAAWEKSFKTAKVHVQWDTERSLRGAALDHYSIQVGISRHLIEDFAAAWIESIEDFTPKVQKMRELSRRGKHAEAKRLAPVERPYPTPPEIEARLGM